MALLIVSGLTGWAAWPAESRGASAVFNQAGDHVYIAREGLFDVDLTSGTVIQIPLPAEFSGEQKRVSAVALGLDGSIYFSNGWQLAALDPASHEVRRLYEPEANMTLDDIAVNPQDGSLFFTTRAQPLAADHHPAYDLYCLTSEQTEPRKVRMRRVDYVEAPVFDEAGNLFFSFQGDLWRGWLESGDESRASLSAGENEVPPVPDLGKAPGWLCGLRVAPLARLETSAGNTAATGVREIAVAGPALYAHTQRMGGSGWGSLLRLDKPAENLEPEDGFYADFINTLSSVKILGSIGNGAYLCAAPDGRRVFYRTENTDDTPEAGQYVTWLVEDNGEPRPLTLTGARLWP